MSGRLFECEELSERGKNGSRFRPLEDEEGGTEEENVSRKGTFRTVIDSGASESVLPVRHKFFRGDTVANSPKKGTKYEAANWTITTNGGQVRLNLEIWEGKRGALSYQVTQVSQSLTSIAQICDLGNEVVFSCDGFCDVL